LLCWLTINKLFLFILETTKDQISIRLGNEEQKYYFMDIDKYLSLPNVIPHPQERLKEYLDKQKIAPKSD